MKRWYVYVGALVYTYSFFLLGSDAHHLARIWYASERAAYDVHPPHDECHIPDAINDEEIGYEEFKCSCSPKDSSCQLTQSKKVKIACVGGCITLITGCVTAAVTLIIHFTQG